MTIRRLELLQWFAFLAGGGIWFAEYLAGTATSQAACNPAGKQFGIPYDTVELALGIFAVCCLGVAEVAAFLVFRATRSSEEQGPPPSARMKFFAVASLGANVIFAMIVVLTTIATVVDRQCHQL
jgi:hypothetical protein